jgi:hypothetical protein
MADPGAPARSHDGSRAGLAHFGRRSPGAASSYGGHFRGVFLNTSVNYPASNGYYVFDITFNTVSWAAGQGYADPDDFGASHVSNKG